MTTDWQTKRTISKTELVRLLDRLSMTQMDYGRWVGKNGRTVRRYVSGELVVPAAIAMLTHALIDLGVSPILPPVKRRSRRR